MSDIMSVSRLRLGTDGEGITTLVAFHGCPLQCKYCCNPHCHKSNTIRADFTAEELIQVLSIDEPYFLMTGGGVTFGGGEPLLQAEFIHEVCRKMNKNWHRTIETSLYADWNLVEMLVEEIDDWFVDIKDVNPEIYKAYTGKSNQKMLSNLHRLAEAVDAEHICIRFPLIPGYNTEEDRIKSIEYILTEIHPGFTIDIFDYEKIQGGQ